MFIELVDILRCVRPHDDIALVAAIDRMHDRDIVVGTLGCPICHAEYAVRDGAVYFNAGAGATTTVAPPSETEALRLAATLALTDPRTIAVLHGAWGAQASLVGGLSPARLIALNPPRTVRADDGVSVVYSDVAPLATASVHAAAVDHAASAPLVDSLVRGLRPGGRMLGAVAIELPAGVRELARDDEIWVGERDAGGLVAITPSRRSPPR
jgi:hypothetical protein